MEIGSVLRTLFFRSNQIEGDASSLCRKPRYAHSVGSENNPSSAFSDEETSRIFRIPQHPTSSDAEALLEKVDSTDATRFNQSFVDHSSKRNAAIVCDDSSSMFRDQLFFFISGAIVLTVSLQWNNALSYLMSYLRLGPFTTVVLATSFGMIFLLLVNFIPTDRVGPERRHISG
eukprot:CAMPEP_0113888650 /NCGR_PEP_ID=MMETSP0780_2-20120614/12992_1 /TAXON_ID=652834 /ORGANISM="Palpitomonas bilix" /LENGTH=173 /DNA_ID=CAMNT_0000877527 /DNA_START=817 /DNA_END=1338 /DNA_ORIENTATION=+ /assembly_acc=CAM_ASM_000599